MRPRPELLLDKNFVADYFSRKITKPAYVNIDWRPFNVTPIKVTTNNHYHLVLRYDIEQIDQPIFCSAHATQDRLSAYRALKYINSQVEKKVKPLFYSRGFNALFYLGANGENLQYFIKKEPDKVSKIVELTAVWLNKLHQIKTDPEKHNFNHTNSQVRTVIPGTDLFFPALKTRAPHFLPDLKKIFETINAFDQENLARNGHYLIHGDFHPENIIYDANDPDQLAIIDYADICLADFVRDLSSFLHQLNYMAARFNPALAPEISKLEKIFLETYLREAKLRLTEEFNQRIIIYKAWSAFRNAIFFALKGYFEPIEAQKSIDKAKYYLQIK